MELSHTDAHLYKTISSQFQVCILQVDFVKQMKKKGLSRGEEMELFYRLLCWLIGSKVKHTG